MVRSVFFMIAAMLLTLLSGCFSSHETIRDIRILKQDHSAYLDINEPGVLMSPEEQRRRDQDYNKRHFSPWHRNKPQSSLADIDVEFEKYERNPGCGENGRKHTSEWMEGLKRNARLQEYFGNSYPAITIRRSSLRSLPTERPHFNCSGPAASGYPFDNLQNTAVMVNTPVLISHISRDNEWVWAETGYCFGWMQAQDVAFLPAGFMEKWETGRYAVVIKDRLPISDEKGLFLFRASLGTFFPLVHEGEDGVEILTAVADQDRRAVLKNVKLPTDAAAIKPVPIAAFQVARLANQLLNEPYGWGGLYGNRDCSAMTRDLLAPFGIWLPRNSGDQALEGGTFIDLSKLSAEEKERIIISEGIPYLTLLWRRGHIMLYMGAHDGKPIIFHNFWGISTRSALGCKGKLVVGHAAVTTLQPGRELHNYDEAAADLMINLKGMTLLVGGPGQRASADR